MFERLGRVSEGNDGKIIKDENEEIIVVGRSTYVRFFRAGGGWGWFAAL